MTQWRLAKPGGERVFNRLAGHHEASRPLSTPGARFLTWLITYLPRQGLRVPEFMESHYRLCGLHRPDSSRQ
jgi:hypothetical protein